MKKLLLIALAFCTFTACDDDDNSDLWEEVKNQGNKIEMLESEIEALKLKIEGLNQTFKAITEMLNGGLITKVEEVTDDNGKKGYTFTIQTYSETAGTQINTYTIWNGDNGKDGEDGTAGSTPEIGMEKEEETELYYWTLNGEPMKDADGKLIYTSKAPQLRINDSSKWEISYDDGATWTELGVFTGTISSSSIVVEVVEGNVVIKQDGKDDITIPIVENNIKITFKNVPANGMSVIKNGVYLVEYELENASSNATVKAEMLNGTNFEVENLPDEKKFKITVKGQNTADVVLVHVYDGGVSMHTSFKVTPNVSIKAVTIDEPDVLLGLEAGSDDVEYEGTLSLENPASEALTFSIIPVGTYNSSVFDIESTVTIRAGELTGTYKVVVKRSAMSLGTAYTIPSIIFSGENANYHVGGAVTMTAGILVKVTLGADMFQSKYTSGASGDGDDIGALCDGNNTTYWGSNYFKSCPAGDAIYGIYIDVTLPQKMLAVSFKYHTRNGGGLPKKLALGAGNGEEWTLLGTCDQSKGMNESGQTPLYIRKDKTNFTKVRFGMTLGQLAEGAPSDGASGILTGSVVGKDNSSSVALAELEVYGLY